jgi:PilZ domain
MPLAARLRRHASAGVPAMAREGDQVWITKARERVRGRIVSSGPRTVSLVTATQFEEPMRRRSRVELEWLDPAGLAQVRGRVAAVQPGPPLVAEIKLRGRPKAIERRNELRVSATLDVSGWSLQDPTRLLSGKTVDLSNSAALLELPQIPETATTLDLRIDLPDGPFLALGHVVRRAAEDFVAVLIEPKDPEELERVTDFVSARLHDEGAARGDLP